MISNVIHVRILDDNGFENNIEVFACNLSTNVSLLRVQSATVNILDNESEPITIL